VIHVEEVFCGAVEDCGLLPISGHIEPQDQSGLLRKGFLLEPMAAAFSPDGKSVLVGGIDKTVFVADPETGKVQRTNESMPLPQQSPRTRVRLTICQNGS
jgi:WD40 repeat protein